MLPTLILISSIILFKSSFILAAPPIAQVVSNNGILQDLAIQTDEDVNAVNAVNGPVKVSPLLRSVYNIGEVFYQYAADDLGIAGSNDPGTEDTVTESFNTLTGAMAKLMDDLVSKKKTLVLYGQQKATYTQLVALRGAFLSYASVVAPLVQDRDHSTKINDSTTIALGAIEAAKEEFAPNDKPI